MTNSEFQLKIAQTGKPVIVDFWAPWCVPCRITKPILEKLAEQYAENVQFLEINADESPDILEQFNVAGIPTVLALRNGKVMGRATGAGNKTGYRAMFESLVNGKEVKFALSTPDRILRLMASALLIAVGISNASTLVLAIGGIVAFLGVYDRCPLWATIIKQLKEW